MKIHPEPKQILVNAHINLKNELANKEIVETFNGIENNINEAVQKIGMIFLKTASLKDDSFKEIISQYIS